MGVPIRLVLALEVVVEVGGPPATGGALQTTIDYIIGSKERLKYCLTCLSYLYRFVGSLRQARLLLRTLEEKLKAKKVKLSQEIYGIFQKKYYFFSCKKSHPIEIAGLYHRSCIDSTHQSHTLDPTPDLPVPLRSDY